MEDNHEWQENVLLIDADYVDRLVFNLSVQLERMLGRRIPKLDIARWIDYLVLDGGLRPGENKTQVLFIYSKEKALLKNAVPSSLPADLDGKSFHDNLGDFFCASFPVEEEIVSRERLYMQSVETLLAASKVSNLMLVPDMESYGHLLKTALSKQRKALLFVNEPVAGFLCPQEILTYSLFAALGVKGEELS